MPNRVRNTLALTTTLSLTMGASFVWAGDDNHEVIQGTLDPADINIVNAVEGPFGEHCETQIASGKFEAIFICGDEFFEFDFNAVDGGGANVGNGTRWTRLPRADLTGPRHWANHFPMRTTGPNAGSCADCHSFPVGTAAGRNGFNTIRDPQHRGHPEAFIQRNTPHLMGSGALQLLAEEMNAELEAIVEDAVHSACTTSTNVRRKLLTKGVHFGRVRVIAKNTTAHNCPRAINIRPRGIDRDLVVKPYQWKGTDSTMRGFVRDALHNEIGMQPVELVGFDVDGDFDHVVNEATVEDVTAMTIYVAGQARPVTEIELNELRESLEALGTEGERKSAELGLPHLSDQDITSINRGEQLFAHIKCTKCHLPQMTLSSPIFSEPSQNPKYRDSEFPAGMDPIGLGVNPDLPISFNITTDMLDNHIKVGTFFINLANFKTNNAGETIVALYGDLKRHNMGPGLAENIDESGHGASVWMTKELWGIGSTGQYMHDGRAGSITEAILLHGGEALRQKSRFVALPTKDKQDLVRFLKNLVIFKVEEEE